MTQQTYNFNQNHILFPSYDELPVKTYPLHVPLTTLLREKSQI